MELSNTATSFGFTRGTVSDNTLYEDTFIHTLWFPSFWSDKQNGWIRETPYCIWYQDGSHTKCVDCEQQDY